MMDVGRDGRTMRCIGREDRALLRSNPSARPDAGTWTGASPTVPRLSPPQSVLATKRKTSGVWGQSPQRQPRRGVTYVKIGGAGM